MREILFRGKCTDTGKWYEGQYIHLHKTTYCFKADYDNDKDNDIHQIVFERMSDWGLPNHHLRADVLPETVGQFTGLTDKNGKKIFEGDIIKIGNKTRYVFFGVCCYRHTNYGEYAVDLTVKDGNNCEIIGNIHDNPELLKGGADNDL